MNTDWHNIHYPSRIVCTATESVDILYRLGLGDKEGLRQIHLIIQQGFARHEQA